MCKRLTHKDPDVRACPSRPKRSRPPRFTRPSRLAAASGRSPTTLAEAAVTPLAETPLAVVVEAVSPPSLPPPAAW